MMHKRVLGVVVVVALFVGVFLFGLWLWWPPGAEPNRCSALGTALMAGSALAFVAFCLERKFSSAAERRGLRLQLGLKKDLSEIDLFERDLSGFHLTGKILKGSDLTKARLRGANLSGADLTNAKLYNADLRGAKLDSTPLYPGPTLKPHEGLKPGGIYPDATTWNTKFSGSKYDDSTSLPSTIDPEECGMVMVNSWWRRIFSA